MSDVECRMSNVECRVGDSRARREKMFEMRGYQGGQGPLLMGSVELSGRRYE